MLLEKRFQALYARLEIRPRHRLAPDGSHTEPSLPAVAVQRLPNIGHILRNSFHDVRARSGQRWAADLEACRRSGESRGHSAAAMRTVVAEGRSFLTCACCRRRGVATSKLERVTGEADDDAATPIHPEDSLCDLGERRPSRRQRPLDHWFRAEAVVRDTPVYDGIADLFEDAAARRAGRKPQWV